MNGPSRRWKAVLRLVLPARDRDTLLDELDRMYVARAESDGPKAAGRWYRSEVLQFVRGFPLAWAQSSLDHVGVEVGDALRLTRRTVRGLLRAPGFATLAVVTLGLGMGASAVIVGLADRALLRALPYPDPQRLVAVLDGWGTSLGALEILQRDMTTVESLGGAQNALGMTLERDGSAAERVSVASVSPEYLEALSVVPALGRTFDRTESQPGQGLVVLLGNDFWERQFGGDSGVLNRRMVLDGESYAIVGVLPPGFDMPTSRNDIWRPTVMDASKPGLHWGAGNHSALARMAPGATPELVRQELLRLQEQVRTANPLWTPNPNFWDEARVTPLGEARASAVRGPLLVLLGAVALLLLVVCANVANLFLSRGLARSRDFAVRSALGAGSGRLAREQLFESFFIATLGLAAGLVFAGAALTALRPYLPVELPGAQQVSVDGRVVLITAIVALATALLAGALPAFRASRHAPATFLRESTRSGSASPTRRRTTRWLVAAQLAAAVVLVTSAGLLTRTLMEMSRVDLGVEVEDRVTARVHLPPGLPTDHEARATYLDGLIARLQSNPALAGVSLASTVPLGSEDEYIATAIDGVTIDPNDLPVIPHHRVSPEFFEVAGIPLTQGRAFNRADRPGAPMVAIVDETFVRRFLGDGNVLGQIVRYPWRGAPPMEIVGVVGNTSHGTLTAESPPTVWVPLAQMGMGAIGHAVVVARTSGSPDMGLAAIAGSARELDERIAVSDMTTYGDLVAATVAGTRLVTLLLLIFAGTTLVLGCVGVYGVAAFSVRERLKEIGVRMAMGAPVEGIRRGVFRDGLRLAIPGSLLGVVLAIPVAQALEGIVFGIRPIDPLTFSIAPLILGLAAVAALYIPARRATRVDPATVLRDS
ncbi:MAG: ADOP family duplicated permease [Longimicrobiales bacterium]